MNKININADCNGSGINELRSTMKYYVSCNYRVALIYIFLFIFIISLNVQASSDSVFSKFYIKRHNIELQKEIQQLVYNTAKTYLTDKKIFNYIKIKSPLLKLRSGVFVTITKNNKTRGCWGTIAPTNADITGEIIENTIKALVHDYRFKPVNSYELPDLRFFISIVGSLTPVESIAEVNPSIHGLLVISSKHNGVLLPKEAKIANWQLKQCLNKAGIKKGQSFRMFIFKTVVFCPIK